MADESIKDAAETATDKATDETTRAEVAAPSDAELGDAGKAALKKERDARTAAEKETKRLQKLIDDAAAERAKADEADAAKRGEFEELAAKREGERDAAKDEAAKLQAENDQLRAAISEQVDAGWKALPKEVADVYPGADDDPLAKLAFLSKSKSLVEKLTDKTAARGNGADPKGSGDGKPDIKSLITKQQAGFSG
jgi:hypothetical protein